MDRTEFVHMVALVRAGACIHEREHSGDQQGRFVVGHRKRTGEDCAGLSVFALTVAEEQRIRG